MIFSEQKKACNFLFMFSFFFFFCKRKRKIHHYIFTGYGGLCDKSSASRIIGSGSGSDGDENSKATDGNASQKGEKDLHILLFRYFFKGMLCYIFFYSFSFMGMLRFSS